MAYGSTANCQVPSRNPVGTNSSLCGAHTCPSTTCAPFIPIFIHPVSYISEDFGGVALHPVDIIDASTGRLPRHHHQRQQQVCVSVCCGRRGLGVFCVLCVQLQGQVVLHV